MVNDRYSRQILFQPIGVKGQEKIQSKHILIIGAGALGTASAEAFVRAGIGKLTIIDRDYVEWSNLQRQQLYSEQDAEMKSPKAVAAKNRLANLNSDVEIEAIVMDASIEDLEQLVPTVDLIIDATDNFDIRFIMNDLAQKFGTPWIYGACVSSYGLSFTVIPNETPCLNCLLESVPLAGMTCDTVGIISPTVQMVVAHQVTEGLKLLVEDYQSLSNKLISFDLWKNERVAIDVDQLKKDDCPSCGIKPSYPYLSYEAQTKTAILCGRDTVQIRPPTKMERDLDQLAEVIKNSTKGTVTKNPFLLSFEANQHRMVVFKDGRALVHGTKDIALAKSLYHKYLG